MNKILDFYRAQLNSLGFVDKEGLLYLDEGVEGSNEPVMFKYDKVERHMVLPTYQLIKDGLANEHGDPYHAFHPMCENVLTGESGTIRFLKVAIRNRIFSAGINLVQSILVSLAEEKSSRNAKFKKFLMQMTDGIKGSPKFDKTLLLSWKRVAEYIDEQDIKKVIKLVISVDQRIDGQKYLRAANYYHMFSEESQDGTATYFGAKVERKQDKVIIHNLLNTIFSWYPEEIGSNDQRPYYGALIRGWAEFVVKYNEIATGVKDVVPTIPILDDSWVPMVSDLEQFDGQIRQTLPFNTGSRKADEDTTHKEYRLSRTTADDDSKPLFAAATPQHVAQEEPKGLMAQMAAANPAPKTDIFGRPVNQFATPLERKLYEEGRGQELTQSGVAGISLAAALNGKVAPQQGSLFDTVSNGSMFSTNNGGGGLFGNNNASNNSMFSAPTTQGMFTTNMGGGGFFS